MTHDEFKQTLCELGFEQAVVIDDECFDGAVIGVSHDGRLIYGYELLVEALVREGMDEEDAADYISFNIEGSLASVGEFAPIIMYPLDI